MLNYPLTLNIGYTEGLAKFMNHLWSIISNKIDKFSFIWKRGGGVQAAALELPKPEGFQRLETFNQTILVMRLAERAVPPCLCTCIHFRIRPMFEKFSRRKHQTVRQMTDYSQIWFYEFNSRRQYYINVIYTFLMEGTKYWAIYNDYRASLTTNEW